MPSTNSVPIRVAYLVSEYPSVSHTFIRREIQALEAQGLSILRLATRGWDDALVSDIDFEERKRTRYILKDGLLPILGAALRTASRRPGPFFSALRATLRMSRHSLRPLPYHFIWLAQACQIKEWLVQEKITHLHAHYSTNPAQIALLVHILGGPPYSFTSHGPDEIERGEWLHLPEKVGGAKFVAAISSHTKSQIQRRLPTSEWSKVNIVHCGLTPRAFEDLPDSNNAFPKDPVFLCIGRLASEKAQPLLMDAFAAVKEKHPRATLVLAGDGPNRAELEAYCTQLGLDDAMRITGWITPDQVRQEIDNATAMVLPSFVEGLPVAIMESMARMRPVISTYVAGIPELILPGKTGWLVPAGDTAALQSSMLELASFDVDQLLEMGKAGQTRVRERHLVEHEAAKLKALFLADDT